MNLHLFLALISAFTLFSCSKKSSKKIIENYSILYSYQNTLSPGDGVVDLPPIDAFCVDKNNVVVDDSFCPDLDRSDLSSAPKKPTLSPPGNIQVVVDNSEQGLVNIPIEEGLNWPAVDDSTRRNKLNPFVTCVSGYTLNFRGDCVLQGYSYSYGVWPENTLNSCEGHRIVSRTYLCIDDVTGDAVDYFFCSGTPDISKTHLSPSGAGVYFNPSTGDMLKIVCGPGKTSGDIGNGSSITGVETCGNQRHLAQEGDITCTPDSYEVSAVRYPENPLNVGDGSLEVTALEITECRASHNSQIVSNSFCSGYSLSNFKKTYLSPQGTIDEVNLDGDTVRYTLGEGETKATPGITVSYLSCGTNRHLELDSCYNDRYLASSFVYPNNPLAPGEGSLIVSATGFEVCIREHDSLVMDNSFCELPTPTPEIEFLSPEGNVEITIANSLTNPVLFPVAEGELFSAISELEKALRIDAVLVCKAGYYKENATCKPETKLATLEFDKTLFLKIGIVASSTPTLNNEDSVDVSCTALPSDSTGNTLGYYGLSLSSDCKLSGTPTISTSGIETFKIKVSSSLGGDFVGENESEVKIKTGRLVTEGPVFPMTFINPELSIMASGDILVAGVTSSSGVSNRNFKISIDNSKNVVIQEQLIMNTALRRGCLGVIDDFAYYVGGTTSTASSNHFKIFDDSTGIWSSGPSVPFSIMDNKCISHPNGNIYSVSGIDGTTPSNKVAFYNPEANSWTSLANIPLGVQEPSVVLLSDGRIGVIGGNNSGSRKEFSLYNPTTNTWEVKPQMNVGRMFFKSIVLNDDSILAIGSSGPAVVSTELYQFSTNTWTNMPSLPAGMGSGGAHILLKDGRVLTVGGAGYSDGMQVFDPEKKTWKSVGTLLLKLNKHAIKALPDGRLITVGGETSSGTQTNRTQIIDPDFID